MNQSELARRTSALLGKKVTAQTVQHACDPSKNAQGSKYTNAFAEVLNVSAAWLEREEGDPGDLHQIANGKSTSHHQVKSSSMIEVPIMSAEGSMGDGNESPESDVVVDVLRLKTEWIRENVRPLTNAGNLSFIHALGHSMEPTIYSGDILLVDCGVKIASNDGVYVLRAHGRIFIKTVRQRLDGVFEISSDNPSIKTAEILNGDHEVEILGRVVYAWHGKRLL